VGSVVQTRKASPASLVWSVADYNTESPVVRRSRSGAVAVVTQESAPVTIRVGTATSSADGATWKLPLTIERRGEFQGAFTVKAAGQSALDKAKEISVPEKATHLVAELSLGDARLPSGTHTLWLQGSVTGKYRQSPEALVAAEAELKEAEKALSSAKPEGKAAAETRKKEAEARRKSAEEKAKPRDLTLALWSEPFTVTVGATAKPEAKP
jgi:Tfp pilus assembly protein PilX